MTSSALYRGVALGELQDILKKFTILHIGDHIYRQPQIAVRTFTASSQRTEQDGQSDARLCVDSIQDRSYQIRLEGFRLKADLVHLVYLVCLVYLAYSVCLVCLVYLVVWFSGLSNKTDQMTRQTRLQPINLNSYK